MILNLLKLSYSKIFLNKKADTTTIMIVAIVIVGLILLLIISGWGEKIFELADKLKFQGTPSYD
ncbi:MAG: hypothetical protein AB7V77_03140 [Candidatus Woesearchaeota archaeon]